MADAGFFKGTSAEQDRRFSDKEMKLLKSMKFPPEFDKKVDMRKVNLTVIRPWVAKKIIELVGFEDEVVVEYAMGLLEDESQPTPDPKKMQINLTGFLTKDTPAFMSALWKLLLEAQDDITGVPRTMVEEKKQEIRRARENDTRAIDERDRRARLDEVHDRGRGGGPGRGRGRGRGRGGGGFEDDRRPRDGGWGRRGGGPGGGGGRNRRESRSPPPHRRNRSASMASSRGSRSPPRRYRSPPRQRVRSRSPSGSHLPHLRSSIARSLSRSRSPSPIRSSRSRSPINHRRPRSPSFTPPIRERDYDPKPKRRRVSRSPPRRRRRGSPGSRSHADSMSRSRSPPPRAYHPHPRRRSASPPPRGKSPSLRDRRRRSPSSPTFSRSPSPRRGGGRRPPYRGKRRYESRSRSRTPKPGSDRMDIDSGQPGGGGELKIRGQAEVERRKSKWDEGPSSAGDASNDVSQAELEKRENELKEKALRNKVMRTRKGV